MRIFGLIVIIVGCLMGAPALALVIGGKAAYGAIGEAMGPIFPFVADIVGEAANKAHVTGAKMLATSLVMIIGGMYLRRPSRESESEE